MEVRIVIEKKATVGWGGMGARMNNEVFDKYYAKCDHSARWEINKKKIKTQLLFAARIILASS